VKQCENARVLPARAEQARIVRQSQIGGAPDPLDTALAIARAELSAAEALLEKTRVRAPFAGTILRLRFSNVTFGASLHGHSGVQWVTERVPSAERIQLLPAAVRRQPSAVSVDGTAGSVVLGCVARAALLDGTGQAVAHRSPVAVVDRAPGRQFLLACGGCWMTIGILVMKKMINFKY
jgi:hypothetical protein